MRDFNRAIRVGILRGGVGGGYDESLKHGSDMIAHVIEYLYPKYRPVDIFIDREGAWHAGGVAVSPADLARKVDLIYNTIGGEMHQTLNDLSVPFVGNSAFADLLHKDRSALHKHMRNSGVKVPRRVVFPVFQSDLDGNENSFAMRKAKEVHEKFPGPWFVYPLRKNKNVATHTAKTFPDLIGAIEDVADHGESIVVEELIPGRKSIARVIPGFRGHDLYHLPIFFEDETDTINKTKITKDEEEEILSIAKDLLHLLDAKHYLEVHFVHNKNTGVHLVDVSLVPDLAEDSSLSDSLEHLGLKNSHILSHILDQAFDY